MTIHTQIQIDSESFPLQPNSTHINRGMLARLILFIAILFRQTGGHSCIKLASYTASDFQSVPQQSSYETIAILAPPVRHPSYLFIRR
jgi:hypothetical protein